MMNVFSCFDGKSGGQIALNKLGFEGNYFASEIDKHAIKVTQANYPSTVRVGDISRLKGSWFPEIDLMMGGSPCQGFSFSGKMLNFKDSRSKLFFEFVRLLEEIQPKYWFLENVVMKKEFEDIITKYLGVKPVKINSSTVSAQNRTRLYWANFHIPQPEDKGIILFDIIEDSRMSNPAAIRGRRLSEGSPTVQCLEVKSKNIFKSNCLTTVSKDNVLTSLPPGKYPDAFKNNLPFRYYTLNEYCRLQNVPENYFDGIVSENQAKKMLGNGWTVDIIVHILASSGLF